MGSQLEKERVFYSIREVAVMIGVSVSTIRRWERSGQSGFPKLMKLGQRSVRFRARDINLYVDKLSNSM